jgi:hypothetical protein
MTVVSNPTALNAPVVQPRGLGGKNMATEQALDAANGNKVAITQDSEIIFRTTAAALATITVYADANNQELPIDVLTVPSNAVNGGVLAYRPPTDVDWKKHDTSVASANGSLVFKSSTANCTAASYILQA